MAQRIVKHFVKCRDCGATDTIPAVQWRRAGKPRCAACGGLLDRSRKHRVGLRRTSGPRSPKKRGNPDVHRDRWAKVRIQLDEAAERKAARQEAYVAAMRESGQDDLLDLGSVR